MSAISKKRIAARRRRFSAELREAGDEARSVRVFALIDNIHILIDVVLGEYRKHGADCRLGGLALGGNAENFRKRWVVLVPGRRCSSV